MFRLPALLSLATFSLTAIAQDKPEVLEGHADKVRAIAFSPDGKFLVSGGEDRKNIRLWDTAAGKEVRSFDADPAPILTVAFSPNGQSIVTGGQSNIVRIWDVKSGKEVRVLEGHSKHANKINAVGFLPNGKVAFSASGSHGGGDMTIRLWDVVGNREIRSLKGHTQAINAAVVSRDGKVILSGCGAKEGERTVRLWDVNSGKELRRFEHKDIINAVVISPDGKRGYSASDNLIRVFDLDKEKESGQLAGHTGPVLSLAISTDGKRLLSGGSDKTVRLWDVVTGESVQVFEGHEGPVRCVAFSADGKRAASGGDDKTIRLWAVPK